MDMRAAFLIGKALVECASIGAFAYLWFRECWWGAVIVAAATFGKEAIEQVRDLKEK